MGQLEEYWTIPTSGVIGTKGAKLDKRGGLVSL